MSEEIFAVDLLTIIYAIVLLISFIFTILSLAGAEFGDALDLGVEADIDSDISFISISPFVLAMFGASFGLTGLVTRLYFDMDEIPSILWATGVGLLVGALAQVLFLYVLSPSKSSHYSLSKDATGREAQVIITIPSQGTGQIAFDNVSGRVTLGAQSLTGEEIKRGSFVIVKRITGRVAFVQPTDQTS
jgi:membrane protein implicated in regulation of membrane protease activity